MSAVVLPSVIWPLARSEFCRLQHGLDVGHGQAVAGQLGGIHLDADGWERAAADVDLADALNLRELLLNDGGGFVVELVGAVFIRGEAEDHDGRIGGIDLAIGGIGGEIGGQIGAGGLMAASTSRAAPSMLRLRSNWMVMVVVPRPLVEVISVTPAMWPNWRSSGVATEEAMISALAPGRPALTEMVGKSTCGREKQAAPGKRLRRRWRWRPSAAWWRPAGG